MSKNRKIIMMLVSLLGAVMLWLYVVTVYAPEATTRVSSIPINISGTVILEERGLIITAQDQTSLTVDISTTRANLSKLNAESIMVNADASRIREPGDYSLTCTVTFPDTVRSSDVELLRKSVDAVNVTVTRLERKAFDIELSWTGSVKEGFFLETESAVLDPAQVVVYGPEEEIEKIDRAVVNYDVSDLEETALETLPIVFLDANGEALTFSELTTWNVTETNLTLTVLRTRELTLDLTLEEGGGVAAKNAAYALDPQTIKVKGAAEVIDALPETYVVGNVDLAAISDREELTFPLNLPAGVTNISGETEVQAVVRLTGVSTETVPVSDIRLVNAPEGYNVEITTRTVQVRVRGSSDEVQVIKESKSNGIYVLVDLSASTQTGAFTVSGQVVNSTHPGVSAAEFVDIGVFVSQIPEETDEE